MIVRPSAALGIARAHAAAAGTPCSVVARLAATTQQDASATTRGERRHAYRTENASVSLTGPSRSAARRTRRARRWRGRTTRIFRSRRACCRRRCGRTSRRCTRSRASPTTSPTKAPRRPAERAGAARRLAAAAARARSPSDAPDATAPHAHERSDCSSRSRHSIRSLDLPLALFDDLRERVRSGYHDDSLRLVGRRVRLLPPIGESGRPARAAHRRLSRRRARSIVGCAVHGAAADEFLAGLRPRLASRPAVRAARRAARVPARAKRISRPVASTPRGRARSRSASTVTRELFDGGPRGLRRRAAAGCATSCASPGSAARASSSASSAPARGCFDRPSDARRARRAAARSGARPAGAARGLMARKTSFYYSFLVLPAEQRRAIIAVWDFCRAVDDAVDEEPSVAPGCRPARDAVAFWRAELARVLRRRARRRPPQGQRLQPFIARVRSAAPGVRRRDRRRGDGSRHDALPDVRRSASSTAAASRRRSA